MRRFAKTLIAGTVVASALAAGSASAFWNSWGGGPWGGGGPWYGGGPWGYGGYPYSGGWGGGYPYYGGWGGGYPGYGGWGGGYPAYYGGYTSPRTTTTGKSSSRKAEKK